jgi:hypothetical protein
VDKKPKIIRVTPGTYPHKGVNQLNSQKNIQGAKTKSINHIKILPKIEKDSVIIVGGGPSLLGFDFKLLEGFDTIAVNKAIEYVKNPTYFVTMDYTFLSKTKFSLQEINKKSKYSYFILNTTHSYIKEINGVYVDTRNNMKYTELCNFTGVFKAPYESLPKGFSENISSFTHGSNSGYSALQLALLLGYKNIYLLGFDMAFNTNTHFHNGYKQSSDSFRKNISRYKDIFINSLKNVKGKSIYSCFESSPLNEVIEYVNIHDIIDNKPLVMNRQESIKGLDNLVIVAYYTLNTPYEQEAKKLIASLNKLNLKYDVVGVQNLGNWQANTRFKAQFMLDMLDKHTGKNLLYIDSDAIVHSKPILFENYQCDVAVRWQDFRWRQNECLSGTIFMANNDKTRTLCRIWQNTNNSEGPNAKTFEQWNLGSAIQQMKKFQGLIDKNLPPEYTFIFDSMRNMYPNAKPVIEHFQASRKLKNKV